MLDPRIRTRAYGEHLLEALPSCRLVDDRAEVERFFAEDDAQLDAVSATR